LSACVQLSFTTSTSSIQYLTVSTVEPQWRLCVAWQCGLRSNFTKTKNININSWFICLFFIYNIKNECCKNI
jgi:hypothetical protein